MQRFPFCFPTKLRRQQFDEFCPEPDLVFSAANSVIGDRQAEHAIALLQADLDPSRSIIWKRILQGVGDKLVDDEANG